jgi:hypothetical protein
MPSRLAEGRQRGRERAVMVEKGSDTLDEPQQRS